MNHKDLDVWKKGMKLVEKVYAMSHAFPDAERFGLTSQIRRAAVSIPSNIAEGATRKGDKELLQFLSIAHWVFGRSRNTVPYCYSFRLC